MGAAVTAQGWEEYPKNLEALASNSSEYDHRSYHDQLVADSHRLFGDNSQIRIRVLETGSKGTKHHYHQSIVRPKGIYRI